MKKAVLLAGGTGSRMQPATFLTNKHLLPIYSNSAATPMIMYPIQTLIKSGIEEILIISSREHSGPIIEHLSDGSKFGVDFTYKIQDTNNVPLGIASALRLAKNYTGTDKFAVILGDNFFEESFEQQFKEFESSGQSAHVFLKEVGDICRFGCATLGKSNIVTRIVEKPKRPESNWAVTGLYLYTPHVHEFLPELSLSQRGEVEITDLNNWYVARKNISASILSSFWTDMGTPISAKKLQAYLDKSGYSITI